MKLGGNFTRNNLTYGYKFEFELIEKISEYNCVYSFKLDVKTYLADLKDYADLKITLNN